ncbi:ankyrin repeat and LEM domain-containing protein 1 isoform X2 [Corythoichthys intestinalis]|uniref:ankyrin repeat and LEM domain-containing protein 1 isoform X2 n=1 Tax=Corythoichthys intestinalis TaxID=161448 RepID=UPI0025A6754A|nr:ankyrin repeat and LEM domain-containing protein 1 isoform X2 [Corythoichthys intestinalis]
MEGNTPFCLAEQEDNRRCAQLLLEYQSSSLGTEAEDQPQFRYSVHSDLTDTSGYPESRDSFTSQSSIVSELDEAPLSSTRLSSFFNCANINGRAINKEVIYSRLYEGDAALQHNLETSSFSHWTPEDASLLSSTRMSTLGPTMLFPKENNMFADDDVILSKGGVPNQIRENRQITPTNHDTPSTFLDRGANRKSVSFCDADKCFPVFSPEFHTKIPTVGDTQDNGWISFDLSEYSGFLDSERLATVLPQQGIDVTSPDHVFVFSRESTESSDENMDKTVISHCTLSDSDKNGDKDVKEIHGNLDKGPAHPSGESSSSGGSSSYNSCESDHYTSAMDISIHPSQLPLSEETTKSGDGDDSQAKTDPLVDIFKINKLSLIEDNHPSTNMVKVCADPAVITLSKADRSSDDIQQAIPSENQEPFIPSPFVTDRTQSRQSYYSLRTSKPPEEGTSGLFEETVSKPVRTRNITPRTQKNNSSYSSPHHLCFTWSNSESTTGPDSLHKDYPDTQSNIPGAGSCVNSSQAETIILPQTMSEAFVESETLCDTVILEANHDSSMDSYERNLADVIQAIQGQEVELIKDGDFLTDDVTSTDEATKKATEAPCLSKEDFWITEDSSSKGVSVSSSSSSSYSPKRSRTDSDILSTPGTPGTSCPPRYSMSRLLTNQRSQHLANLSYTPGGRPHIEDADEPVEYLYTDMEQGYKLIEAHIPPTANTSCDSSMSTSSSEDTILYDWRAMKTKLQDTKENQKPPTSPNKKTNEVKNRFLMEIEGMTDKELRRRLIEVGESPGPISRRTRPVYIRRLCCQLQDLNSKPSRPQVHVEQPQTAHSVYSPELNLALQTFKLPDCQGEEQALCQQFDQPDQNKKWREGNIKSSFNYLLLDPRVTRNLPFRSHSMTSQECFQTFVRAIFYVGKGKRSRPYSHLYEALEYYKGDKTSKKLCSKVQQILQVWNAEQGVISLHCFQNVIPVEAYTREACMVEAVGLKMLTNVKRGDFYGVVSNWPLKKKRELGVHLLYRAMQIFLAEGERQLRPADIRH